MNETICSGCNSSGWGWKNNAGEFIQNSSEELPFGLLDKLTSWEILEISTCPKCNGTGRLIDIALAWNKISNPYPAEI